jgi:hypothetical protein
MLGLDARDDGQLNSKSAYHLEGLQRPYLFLVVLNSKAGDLTICQQTQKAPIKAQDSTKHRNRPLPYDELAGV